MSKAIEDLKHEHEAILFTIKILKKVTDLIGEGHVSNGVKVPTSSGEKVPLLMT